MATKKSKSKTANNTESGATATPETETQALDEAQTEAQPVEKTEPAQTNEKLISQQEADDLSRGDIDVEDELQPYRNEGTVNLFTEGGRCRPNQTVMLTIDQAGQYKGLVPCNTASE